MPRFSALPKREPPGEDIERFTIDKFESSTRAKSPKAASEACRSGTHSFRKIPTKSTLDTGDSEQSDEQGGRETDALRALSYIISFERKKKTR